jgi:hypothetical protein
MHVPKHLLLVAEPCQPFSLLTPQEFLGPFLHHCEWGSMVEKVCFEDHLILTPFLRKLIVGPYHSVGQLCWANEDRASAPVEILRRVSFRQTVGIWD